MVVIIQVLLGPLPAGFLRADGCNDTMDADYQAALALQQQICGAAVSSTYPYSSGKCVFFSVVLSNLPETD